MLNHGDNSLILLLVNAVEVDSLGPHLVSFALSDQSWDHQLGVVGLEEVHHALGAVLGVHDSERGVDTLVGSLEVHA